MDKHYIRDKNESTRSCLSELSSKSILGGQRLVIYVGGFGVRGRDNPVQSPLN